MTLVAETHRNRDLFSDHYLNADDRLKALPQWRAADGAQEKLRALSELYAQKAARFTERTNEAQTERDVIRPALEILGHVFEVQEPIAGIGTRPDYAFFLSEQEKLDAAKHKGAAEFWRHPVALGDAKAWDASLDRRRGVEEDPTAKISSYLYRSGVRWGILTNGRLWRLYERERSKGGGVWYEVDLVALLEQGDPEAFKYFYLFFRREAFEPVEGASFVERVLRGSEDYATEVGDKLKDSVYDALRHLMNGFLSNPGNELSAHDAGTIQRVHGSSLVLLYRLLFILYAEDAELLPRSEPSYAEYSLASIHREINEKLRARRPFVTEAGGLWARVKDLFKLIHTGLRSRDGRVVIPAYNGGLFDDSKHPDLADWVIGDSFLAEAVDLLAYERRRWDEPGARTIDYRSLDVQHLGAIYEGLLELRPELAIEPMIERTRKGRPIVAPQREAPNPRRVRGQEPRRFAAAQIYLVTDRAERKATGSYYTPKYIVDYIVENTVGPLAEEAAKKVAALRPEADAEISRLERARRGWEREARNGNAKEGRKHIAELDRGIEDQKRRVLEPYLALKILDPAMGSGHFLVGAADFLSLAMATDPNLQPPTQPSPTGGEGEGAGDEDPQAYYKRLIVERCLYGVDLNPLAVELAKLSLWLHTVSKDKALSFLDHHLRCGNSLIGARIEEDLMKEPPQLTGRRLRAEAQARQLVFGFYETLAATHLQHFLDTFRKIVETPTGDAETEREKDKWYSEMDAAREKYRAVANCWLAPYFGAPVAPGEYERAVNSLRGTVAEWRALNREPWFSRAQAVAAEKRFFHWELEFPEAFFTPTGLMPREERGFDSVVGNPPYVSFYSRESRKPAKQEEDFLSGRFTDEVGGRVNMFLVFLGQARRLVKRRRAFSLIIPDTFTNNESYAHTRRFLFERCHVGRVDRLDFPVFDDSTVRTSIPIVWNEDSAPTTLRLSRSADSFIRGECEAALTVTLEAVSAVDDLRLLFVPQSWFGVIGKIRQAGDRLKTICEVRDGINPGPRSFRELVVNPSPPAKSTWRRMIEGEDIGRYEVFCSGKVIDYDASLVTDSLRKQGVSFREEWIFTSSKLVSKQTAGGLVFAYDDSQLYGLNSVHHTLILPGVPYSLSFALSVLNSRLTNWFYRAYFQETRDVFPQVHISALEKLPIRRIAFTTSPLDRARLVEELKGMYWEWVGSRKEKP
jgi:hypothetical protein